MLPQLQLAEKIVARRKLQIPQLQFVMVVHISVASQSSTGAVVEKAVALPQLHLS